MSASSEPFSGSSFGISILRVHFGLILFAHGWLKISLFTIPGTVGYFAGLGLPSFAAYLTIFGELAAGLALIAGIQTRLASALCVPILMGATIVHLNNGWLFSAEGGGWEFPASLTVIAIALIFTGSGNTLSVNRNPLNGYLPKAIQN